MKVDAVLHFKVVNPERAVIQVQSFQPTTKMLAQTTLPAVLGQHEVDEILAEWLELNADGHTVEAIGWGIFGTAGLCGEFLICSGHAHAYSSYAGPIAHTLSLRPGVIR